MNTRPIPGAPALLTLLAVLTGPLLGADPATPDADQLLRRMSAKLAAAQSFTFSAKREIDPALLEGNALPRKAKVSVSVQRPGKIAAESVSRTGVRRIVADGNTLSIEDGKMNHYTTVPMRTTIDGLVDRLDKRYGFVPPLAEFAVSNPYAEFRQQAHTITYLGTGKTKTGFLGLGGVACHRLALTGRVADAELWIGQDDLLPRKLVATFHRDGQPQLRLDFSAWNLAAPIAPATFTFTPQKGAQLIEMWTTAQMEKEAAKP